MPSDCVASPDPADNEHALRQMRSWLDADTTPSTELDLEALVRRAARRPEDAREEMGTARRL